MNCDTCRCLGEDNMAPYCHHYSRVYPEGRDMQWIWRGGYRSLTSETCPKEEENDISDDAIPGN